MFPLAISCLSVQFTLIHGPNIPGSSTILFLTALDFTFTTRHIHSWVSFLLWPSCFILSGRKGNHSVMSDSLTPWTVAYQAPLSMGFSRQEYWSGVPFPSPILSGAISNFLLLFHSSILDTFQLGGLIFWYHIFLSSHTVHGVLAAIILEWFAILSSKRWHFVRTSSLWSIHLSWPCTTWHIASLGCARPFTKTRLWCMKGNIDPILLANLHTLFEICQPSHVSFYVLPSNLGSHLLHLEGTSLFSSAWWIQWPFSLSNQPDKFEEY